MRLIDADAFEQEVKRIRDKYSHPNDHHWLNLSVEMQAVGDISRHFLKWSKKNAIEVVRCNECEFARNIDGSPFYYCRYHGMHSSAEDFCNYSKRESGEQK